MNRHMPLHQRKWGKRWLLTVRRAGLLRLASSLPSLSLSPSVCKSAASDPIPQAP